MTGPGRPAGGRQRPIRIDDDRAELARALGAAMGDVHGGRGSLSAGVRHALDLVDRVGVVEAVRLLREADG